MPGFADQESELPLESVQSFAHAKNILCTKMCLFSGRCLSGDRYFADVFSGLIIARNNALFTVCFSNTDQSGTVGETADNYGEEHQRRHKVESQWSGKKSILVLFV